MKMENKKQLWALYLGTLSFLGNQLDNDTLRKHKKIWKLINDENYELPEAIIYGAPEIEFDLMRKGYVFLITNFVQQKYDIKHRNDLLWEVDRLIKGSELTKEVSREIQRIKLIPNSYLKELLDNKYKKESKLRINIYKLILMNLESLSSSGIYAYDLANAISLCRIAGVYGYLTKEEIIDKVNSIAKIVHENYSNYQEFAIASRLGYEIDVCKLKDNNSKLFGLSKNNVMDQVGYSIWPHLPWPEKF